MNIPTGILSLLIALVFAGAAPADVVDGDFEAGGAAWSMSAPSDWSIGVQTGGNPGLHGHIQSPFGDSAGIACFEQEFQCGEDDPTGETHCMITFDYYLHIIDALLDSGRVIVTVDGVVSFVSPPGADYIDWTTVTLAVPCGLHRISLCLEVDPQNNGWEAGFDNVIAECEGDTAAETRNWSTVKISY